jgi:hypothetical protein
VDRQPEGRRLEGGGEFPLQLLEHFHFENAPAATGVYGGVFFTIILTFILNEYTKGRSFCAHKEKFMLEHIVIALIIGLATGFVIARLFVRKNTACGCGGKAGCACSRAKDAPFAPKLDGKIVHCACSRSQ